METEADIKDKIIHFIVKNDLYMFPLHSMQDEVCTCGNSSCSSPGKHPLLKYNWKFSATNKIDNIRKWFNKTGVNYAVATGRLSSATNKKLIVVDIDNSKHEIINRLPKTFRYQTGSGGWHYWFWSKYSIPNSVSYLADKVDVRGTNGYVIVPPSIHRSGNRYNFEFTESIEQEILDLPKEFIDILFSKKNIDIPSKESSNKKKQKKHVVTEDLRSWSQFSIKELREIISSGEKIPNGVRNTSIHRLLSSDRANGIISYAKLYSNALKYKSYCENEENITKEEIKSLLKSVCKYESRNTSHTKVNESYFHFMEEKKIILSEERKNLILKLDKDFFNGLSVATDKSSYVGIEDIQQQRDRLFKSNGLKSYSKYPNHLLAAKLREMGFERKRTKNNNLWNVKYNMFIFSGYLDNIEQTELQNLNMESMNMTMKVVEEQTIKIKRKNHPNEHKYPGRASQETSNAIMKLMGILEPEQLSELENKSLVLDEESTAQLFDSILPGDIVGVGQFQDGKGYVATKMKIEKIEDDILYGKDVSNMKNQFDIEITFEDVSIANSIGFAEILMRDDKPYGVDLEVEYKVRLVEEEKSDPTETQTEGTASNTESSPQEETNTNTEINNV